MAEVEAPTIIQKVAAETLGTFVLVLFGCAAFITSEGDVVVTALTFGLTLMLMVYAFGRVSGGHFNPAVSLGAALGGRLPWKQAGIYAAAQLAGGILGAIVLLGLLFGFDGYDAFEGAMGQNFFGDQGIFGVPEYAWWAALLLELVLTAVFVLAILAVTDERNEHPGLAPLAIGFALTAIYLLSVPVTGGSVNPARSIGPALFAGGDQLLQVWVFIVGPLLGAAAAGLAYPAIFGHGASGPVVGSGLKLGGSSGAVPGYGMDQYQQQWNQQAPGGYGGAPAPGGYAAPASYQPAPDPAAQSYQPAPQAQQAQAAQQPVQQQPAEQPIIQDGWQWDPQAQQWIPAQQQPPAQQGGWGAPSGGESTQVRPPEGQ